MANLTLKLLLALLPLAGRKKSLEDLFRLTAAAFAQEPPAFHDRSRSAMLAGYAHFTRSEAEKSMARGTASAVRASLYDRSLRLGREIRSKLPIRSRADAAATLHCLYSMLDIDKAVDAQGAVTIQRCFFATHYTPEVCGFMSAMDEGIVAGLCGGRLVFTQRLTEGADRCRGRIEWPDGPNE
jgi:hypothetical protein